MAIKTDKKVKKPNQIYHRKVARSGGSRYISVGSILPKDWLIVKIKVAKVTASRYVFEITRLD